MEKSRGKIYGFIGPIGGGKTYQLEATRKRSEIEHHSFITGDFSDGIRSSILKIFNVDSKGAILEPSDERYLDWKKSTSVVYFPSNQKGYTEYCFHNRELLKNVGEHIKTLAGEDVWARWTGNYVCRKYWDLPEEKRDYCNIAFGSVRFGVEARMVFNVSKILNKEVNLIFCNHFEQKYNSNVHVSEQLANHLILLGFNDGDDVTQAVKEIYNIK